MVGLCVAYGVPWLFAKSMFQKQNESNLFLNKSNDHFFNIYKIVSIKSNSDKNQDNPIEFT